MKKEVIKQAVDQYLPELVKIADEIYDLAEPGMEEVRSAGLLTDYLEKMGFQVEKGIAGLPTAFRAVYEQGQGGPSFGLLAEYDALKDIGHACGHHMQGPSVIGAALLAHGSNGLHAVGFRQGGKLIQAALGVKLALVQRQQHNTFFL